MDIEEYALKRKHYYGVDIENKNLLILFKKNKFQRIIDVGCGDGLLLYTLNRNGYLDGIIEIWAVDKSKERSKNVVRISPKIKTVNDDAQFLKHIPSNHFDLAITTQVIEHVKNDQEMLYNLARICVKGGVIYMDTVFKKWYGWYFYKNHYHKWSLDPTHEREYMEDEELLNKIRKAGLKLVYEDKELMQFPFIDFFVKRLGILNLRIYENIFFRILRRIKLPIFGYYCWKLVMVK